MGNLEHLDKLKQGVDPWNSWRQENTDLIPNLEGFDLEEFNLIGVNLTNTILYSANLMGANLEGANLEGANLENSNLFKAILYRANLRRSILTKAFLRHADFKEADLTDASLSFANLAEANLFGTNLKRALLYRSNLYRATLDNAVLDDAFLQDSNLSEVRALATNFGGATLTGTCIEYWNINGKTNLKNVKCDYIYLKKTYSQDTGEWIYSDRLPHIKDIDFAPKEFAKRYQKYLDIETVNLYFSEGIDWSVFLNSFRQLQEEERVKIDNGEKEFPRVQGFEVQSDGSFVIKVSVSKVANKEEIAKSFWQKYQPKLEAEKEKFRRLRQVKNGQIKSLNRQTNTLLCQNTHLLEIIKLLAKQQNADTQNIAKTNVNIYGQKSNFGAGQVEEISSTDTKIAGIVDESNSNKSENGYVK